MKTYQEFSNLEPKDFPYTNYKIIVPTEEDRQELMQAFKHIHDSDVDNDIIAVNQLMHEYRDVSVSPEAQNNIIVNKELYDQLI